MMAAVQNDASSGIEIHRLADARSFLERAEPFLLEHEAENNVTLGVAGDVARSDQTYPGDAFFAVVEREGQVVGTALRTPPFKLVLSFETPLAAIPALAREVRSAYSELTGVLGPPAIAQAFADEWSRQTGHRPGNVSSERIYRLTRVVPITGVSGRSREAQEEDRDLMRRWLRAFQVEALPDDPAEDAYIERNIESRFGSEGRGMVFWCDPDPVSMAGFGGMTPNGVRIGAVYTPPDLRRRGYASALVAALSRSLLDRGRRFCFLFTDLANPTSNRIYQQIGYEPVSDVADILFEPPSGR
jgi:predicted GNAT family acetyltransferase